MIRCFVSLITVLCTCVPLLAFQQKEETNGMARKLLKFLGGEYVLDGSVAEDKSGNDVGGGMIVAAGGGSDAPPFEGRFEVVRTADGLIGAVSTGSLPRVAFVDDGIDRMVCTLSNGDGASVQRFADEVAVLLSPEQMSKVAAKVEWKPLTSPQDQQSGMVAEFPARLLRASSGGRAADLVAPRIVAVTVRAMLDSSGEITSLAVAVGRTDPMASFRERAMSGDMSSVTLSPEDLENEDQEVGITTNYRFTKKSGAATKTTMKTIAFLREAAKSGE